MSPKSITSVLTSIGCLTSTFKWLTALNLVFNTEFLISAYKLAPSLPVPAKYSSMYLADQAKNQYAILDSFLSHTSYFQSFMNFVHWTSRMGPEHVYFCLSLTLAFVSRTSLSLTWNAMRAILVSALIVLWFSETHSQHSKQNNPKSDFSLPSLNPPLDFLRLKIRPTLCSLAFRDHLILPCLPFWTNLYPRMHSVQLTPMWGLH